MRVFKPTRKTNTGKTVEYELWYVEFRDHRAIVRRLAGFSDKKQTAELGRKLEKLVACRANNEDPEKELAEWLETAPRRVLETLARYDLICARKVGGNLSVARYVALNGAGLVSSMHVDSPVAAADDNPQERKKPLENQRFREDSRGEKSVPRTRIERATYGLGNRCSIP